jgi:hypothetical protein
MMKLAISAALIVAAAALGCSAFAEEKPAGKDEVKNAAFEKIKALSGEWETSQSAGDHAAHGGTVTYKVTAAGSAVIETLFGGSDHEMITMYFMDGNELALTHYCMLHNRPQMRAEKQTSPEKLVFKCQAGDKIEAEEHMHQETFTFVDADHVKTEWVLYKDGKPASTHSFDLVRKKK